MSYWSHETAIIDIGACIGEGTKIWHWTHICAETQVGKHCSIGQNCFIANNVAIGDRVKVQNNVSLYDGVVIEDDVFCGPSAVFTNVLNPRSHVERKNEFRSTHIKRGATIGANATIVCGVTLGEYCFIGAGAVVTKDVVPHALVAGVPARHSGWVSHAGEMLELPLSGNAHATCPRTGDRYSLSGNKLTRQSAP